MAIRAQFQQLWQNFATGCFTLPQRTFLFACFVLLSLVAAYLCSRLAQHLLYRIYPGVKRYRNEIYGILKLPLFGLFALAGIYNSIRIFELDANAMEMIYHWYFILMVLMVLRGILSVINLLNRILRDGALKSGNTNRALLLDLLVPTAKIIVWVVGVFFILDNVFHFKIGTLLAGAGVASMAVAFAAQNTIANLFGAVSIILDRPFAVGEKIQIEGKDCRVEVIGLRSTRVEAIDGTKWSIPNKVMAESKIVNVTRREFTRYDLVLNLTYAHSPEQIARGKEILRDVIGKNALIDMEKKPPRITFETIGAYSLDLKAVCWFQSNDAATIAHAKDEINFAVLTAFNAAGFDFAFPTQSIVVEQAPENKAS